MHRESQGLPAGARQVVGTAIQNLTAARLGRGFLPLALLAAGGVGQLISSGPSSPGGWALLVGAPITGVAMLAYGLRVVQKAFGRARQPWMTVAGVGSLVPPAFALYVVAWRGLRGLAAGGGTGSLLLAGLFTLIGVWLLRGWMRVVEVERLARVMASNADDLGGPV